MNTFLRFFYEFISIFFEGMETIFKGIYNGFVEMFNIGEYGTLINNYKGIKCKFQITARDVCTRISIVAYCD